MQWFGESWGAPACTPEARAERPAAPCAYCGLAFAETDQGLVLPSVESDGRAGEAGFHLECFLKSVGIKL